jgi:hypothetical protein
MSFIGITRRMADVWQTYDFPQISRLGSADFPRCNPLFSNKNKKKMKKSAKRY